VPTAGLTEYQVLSGANLKAGDRVFINGGAGGTGTMGIQIAKAMRCHVTTSCSGAKRELCRRLGADEVVDYRAEGVAEVLANKGRVFRFVMDNVGGTGGLYRAYTKLREGHCERKLVVHVGERD
jgi:alkaline phosphatase D